MAQRLSLTPGNRTHRNQDGQDSRFENLLHLQSSSISSSRPRILDQWLPLRVCETHRGFLGVEDSRTTRSHRRRRASVFGAERRRGGRAEVAAHAQPAPTVVRVRCTQNRDFQHCQLVNTTLGDNWSSTHHRLTRLFSWLGDCSLCRRAGIGFTGWLVDCRRAGSGAGFTGWLVDCRRAGAGFPLPRLICDLRAQSQTHSKKKETRFGFWLEPNGTNQGYFWLFKIKEGSKHIKKI